MLSLQRHAKQACVQALLRTRPTFSLGARFPGITVVSRQADVREVFNRHGEFSVAPYGVKIRACIGIPSFLGLPDGPEYRRELNLLRRVSRPDDVSRIGAVLSDAAGELVEHAVRYKGSIDMVTELCDPLILTFLRAHFGVTDPGHGVLLHWMRMMSYYVFQCYLGTGPRIEIPAVRAGEAFMEHIRSLVAARREARTDEHAPDDALGRFLALQAAPDIGEGDRHLASSYAAFAFGAFAATVPLMINVLDRLLDLPPDLLEGARHAARRDDDAVVREYVTEAARFSPVPPVVWRYCEQGTSIAEGTERETFIPEGTLVALFISAANMDPSVVEQPNLFRLNRPPEERLLFGHSLHHCVGERLGLEVLTQVTKSMLIQPVWRRMAGKEGLKQSGPRGEFPAGMFTSRLAAQIRGDGTVLRSSGRAVAKPLQRGRTTTRIADAGDALNRPS